MNNRLNSEVEGTRSLLIALDCTIADRVARALRNKGNVVYRAPMGVHDELWFREACDEGADVFVSGDFDIAILCNHFNKVWIKMPRRMRGAEQEKYLMTKLEKLGGV